MNNNSYCMSSYLFFKYIYGEKYDFDHVTPHRNYVGPVDSDRIPVKSAIEINEAIEKQLEAFNCNSVGVFLSGGMDSAIVASYFPGADAYTFRYPGINYPSDELVRAERFAQFYGLKLHYVDITLETMLLHLEELMRAKSSPVYYIEPQLHQAALQAKADGKEIIMVGEGSDLVFGGMGWLLSKDWKLEDFMKTIMSTNPNEVIRDAYPMDWVFEQYRVGDDGIDYIKYIDEIFTCDAYTSYDNAFSVAGIPYFDPFEKLKMSIPLDLNRIRSGEPKYLVRELFQMRYPGIPTPEKIRLPNPLDAFLKDWTGPTRREFLPALDLSKFKGKNKWQILCLEKFLNMLDADSAGA